MERHNRDLPGLRLGEEMERAVQAVEIPIQDDGTIHAELLLHGWPILVTDITAAAPRLYPPVLAMAGEIGVTSFVCAPLKSKHRILGFVGADKGAQQCTQEDLELLTTIASNIGVAIDNALMYEDREKLVAELQSFSHTVAHDLKNPITNIIGFSTMVLENADRLSDEQRRDYLRRVIDNGNKATDIINALVVTRDAQRPP